MVSNMSMIIILHGVEQIAFLHVFKVYPKSTLKLTWNLFSRVSETDPLWILYWAHLADEVWTMTSLHIKYSVLSIWILSWRVSESISREKKLDQCIPSFLRPSQALTGIHQTCSEKIKTLLLLYIPVWNCYDIKMDMQCSHYINNQISKCVKIFF